MLIGNIIRNRNVYSIQSLLTNPKKFKVTKQLRTYYPILLNVGRKNESYSGLVLPTIKYQNHTLQKLLSSDVKSKSTETNNNGDIKKDKDKTTVKETTDGTIDAGKHINDAPALTKVERLKKAVKDYGATVIVFHVGISLLSLGSCYLLVSSGLDFTKIIEAVGLDQWVAKSEIAASAGTFAVAYAIHKVFAPVRITITLGSVPFIVRYLRKVGFLKK